MLGLYYINMNMGSTCLISLIVFIFLFGLKYLINKNNELTRKKYYMLIYNIFIFSLLFGGSLSI